MDLFKAITGKNPAEYEQAASLLVNTPNVDLYKKLVKQDSFLFDFVKNNVAIRIQKACNKDNYMNILSFFEYYSSSYANMFAEVLTKYGDDEVCALMKNYYKSGNISQKAYAAKYFCCSECDVQDLIEEIRENAFSEDDDLSANSIEVLSKLNDEISKKKALDKLESKDEFEQFDGIKFLVSYQAKGCIDLIIDIMKKSSLSENIAVEIPFLISLEELLEKNFDKAILVICNIVNAIPEIVSPFVVIDFNLMNIFEHLYYDKLTSTSALLLRMAKDKFSMLVENDEYLFDCDKNTKDEVYSLNDFLQNINSAKLDSLLYEELYDESDFVFYAIDYVDNVEELETLLDSSNQTLILKVLTILKEKNELKQHHKELALKNVTNENISSVISVL